MSTDPSPPKTGGSFRIGLNYWPARTAMRWWTSFDHGEVAEDFARIAASGLDSVRLFLTWEDFQPNPDRVDTEMLFRLVAVADLASQVGLCVMPTLFTGHMSGVNWIPPWALGGRDGDERFRVVSAGGVTADGLRNWYTDSDIGAAQSLLAGEAARALAGHDATWAWDLGNENSNCVRPPNRALGRDWLHRISAAIRAADDSVPITTGLHMEDLQEDRMLGPREASEVCDFLTMHGYPIYADWAESPTDEHVLPYLAHITRWQGRGRDVLFSEFGLPTYRSEDPQSEGVRRPHDSPIIEEGAAGSYIDRALDGLHRAGCLGAMLWCYSDYAPAIWDDPPLDAAVHERSFGLWRSDGSPKPSVGAIDGFRGTDRIDPPSGYDWIDIEPDEFFQDPGTHLRRLYRRYRSLEGLRVGEPGEEVVERDDGDADSNV